MKLLALDTSTDLASIALAVDGELYSEEQGNVRQHAQFLLPMIERVMALGKVSFNQLDGIVFGCGPGSFTGLRVACAVAKGLAFAHDLPLYPVSSLKAIANEVWHEEGKVMSNTSVLAMIDARMQQVYWAYMTPEALTAKEQVSNAVDVILPASNAFILAGVGYEAYTDQLPTALLSQCILQRCAYPHARAMIRLVESGICPEVAMSLALPIYVRNDVAAVSTK